MGGGAGINERKFAFACCGHFGRGILFCGGGRGDVWRLAGNQHRF